MLDRIAVFILILSPSFGYVFAARGLIHYFQLESYQFPGYFSAVRRNLKRSFLPGVMLGALLFTLYFIAGMIMDSASEDVKIIVSICVFILSALGGIWIGKLFQDKKAKKALNFTSRVKRLYIAFFLVSFLACMLFMTADSLFAVILMSLMLPLWVPCAGLAISPVEKCISEWYFRDAQKKLLSMPQLIRIGITGSYGKTSVKFFLGTILSEKYITLVTPASFNTPMGVTRVIREQLSPSHQVFLSEMGARHVGDIKEMCRLVHPNYAILTSVGPQHLETFKTIERVTNTKYELINALPDDGFAVFPDDQGICKALYEKTGKAKTLVSVHGKANVYATECKATPEGTAFILNVGSSYYPCKTKLLGEHNIQNILLAAAMALHIGLTPQEVISGISKLEPVEHRLKIVPSARGMTIIDDAFNSNPVGASAALKVLKSFSGRRIIITPGMVELGDKEAEYNRAFGREMAESVDVAILIGKKHADPMAQGLKEAGFDMDKVMRAGSLDESTMLLQKLMRAGDVILYENDLPDNYNEA